MVCFALLTKVQIGNRDSWENYYVNGRGSYFMSSATLEMLRRDYGIRFDVEYGFTFAKRAHIFNDYVHTFYKMKRENKGNALYYISKFMLNALYGKLGQSRWTETIMIRRKGLTDFVSFDDYFGLVMILTESKNKFILPYLASYITELARLHHFKIMREVENELYYCDTDSILTTSKKLDDRVSPLIGDLSYKGEYKGIFLAPKTYALKNKKEEIVTFKGFDPKEFSFADFKATMNHNAELSMTRERILSFVECTRIERMRLDHNKGKTEQSIVHERDRYLKLTNTTKRVVAKYNKRVVFSDRIAKFVTIPFTFDEVHDY